MIERLFPGFLLFISVCATVIVQAEDTTELPEWCRKLPRPIYRSLDRLLADEPWFEVYKIRPCVFAIYEPRQFQEVISFLITGKDRALLLDTGMGIASIRKVVSKLTSLPVIVINTHSHPDHVGGNAEFSEIWGIDGDYTRSNANGNSKPWLKDWVHPPNVCGQLPEEFNPAHYKIAPFKITHYVKDGDEIDLGDRQIQVILTQGHTPDSLCIYDQKNRLLFTGDTFYPGPIYLFVPETDFTSYVRSVDRIASMKNVDLLLPSHNEPTANPKILSSLLQAAQAVQTGKAKFTVSEGLREYAFDGFSLLLAPKP